MAKKLSFIFNELYQKISCNRRATKSLEDGKIFTKDENFAGLP